MAKILTFNSFALALLGGAPKVRVRVKDGVLQVRPGDRANVASLPKSEDVRELKIKMEGDKAKGASVNLKITDRLVGTESLEVGAAFQVVEAKYGWLSLAQVAEPAKGTPYARVAAK
jgi:hypothetical protein